MPSGSGTVATRVAVSTRCLGAAGAAGASETGATSKNSAASMRQAEAIAPGSVAHRARSRGQHRPSRCLDRSGATGRPRSTTSRGSRSTARSTRGSSSKTTRSAGTPSVQRRRPAQPLPGPPGAGAQDVLGGRELGHPGDLGADQAVRQRAARIGAGIDRHAQLVRGPERLEPALVQRAHVLRVRRELRLAGAGIPLEVVELDHRRHQRYADARPSARGWRGRARCRARSRRCPPRPARRRPARRRRAP